MDMSTTAKKSAKPKTLLDLEASIGADDLGLKEVAAIVHRLLALGQEPLAGASYRRARPDNQARFLAADRR